MADAAPVDFIVKVGLCNQSLIAVRESEGCHTKTSPRDPVPFGKDHTTYQHSVAEIAPDSATLND
jgi:hypothetical protein